MRGTTTTNLNRTFRNATSFNPIPYQSSIKSTWFKQTHDKEEATQKLIIHSIHECRSKNTNKYLRRIWQHQFASTPIAHNILTLGNLLNPNLKNELVKNSPKPCEHLIPQPEKLTINQKPDIP